MPLGSAKQVELHEMDRKLDKILAEIPKHGTFDKLRTEMSQLRLTLNAELSVVYAEHGKLRHLVQEQSGKIDALIHLLFEMLTLKNRCPNNYFCCLFERRSSTVSLFFCFKFFRKKAKFSTGRFVAHHPAMDYT